MLRRAYIILATLLFAVLAALNAVRFVMGWQIYIHGTAITQLVSFISFGIFGYMVYEGWRHIRRP